MGAAADTNDIQKGICARESTDRIQGCARGCCGAGSMPRDLWDITQGRLALPVKRVRRAPKTRLRPDVIEISSAHCHVERSRSNSAHRKAVSSYRGRIEIVAPGGARISGGDHCRDTLLRPRLPEGVEKVVTCGTQTSFAVAETHAHHPAGIVVYHV